MDAVTALTAHLAENYGVVYGGIRTSDAAECLAELDEN